MVSSGEARYYDFGRYRLDISNDQLLKNNEAIPLTQKSVEILRFLVQNRGEVLNKTSFFNNVWAESYVDETNLTQHIYRIRKVLGNSENGNIYIETIPKYGYRFIGEVKEIYDDSSTLSLAKETNLSSPPSGLEKKPANNEETPVEAKSASKNSVKTSREKKPSFASLLDKRTLLALFIGAIISLVIYQGFAFFSQSGAVGLKTKSVLILPFKQIGEANDERLGLGTADAIISKLGSLEEITVIPTESIITYAKKDSAQYGDNLFKIGRKMNADIIITGTIQREGESVRINVMFYRANDKQQLCSAKFDEEFSNVFSLQDSISGRVLNKLLTELNDHSEHVN